MTTPDSDGLLAEQLLRLTRRVHRIQKHHLEQRDLGITPAQSRLLRTLAHFDSPPRMADLAERLEVVPRAVTTLVDGLEASGKVRRVPDPSNRRVIRIEITDDGRGALRELRGARRSAADEILAPLTDVERAVLRTLLDTLVDGAAGERVGDGEHGRHGERGGPGGHGEHGEFEGHGERAGHEGRAGREAREGNGLGGTC